MKANFQTILILIFVISTIAEYYMPGEMGWDCEQSIANVKSQELCVKVGIKPRQKDNKNIYYRFMSIRNRCQINFIKNRFPEYGL